MLAQTKSIFVALSGGVDSSTTAALLLKAGFDCSGIFMLTGDHSAQARSEAERIAEKLRIKLYILDLREDFESVLDYFCNEYKKGRTPNPCVYCNRHIKFDKLWNFARDKAGRFFSTGHYAKILKDENNETGLYAAVDTAKDQSYALAMINREILPNLILPMGDYHKDRIKKMAVEFGLSSAQSKESQEICFIPDNDYVAELERRCPELVRKGSIVDSSGNVLGEHNGVHRFTIGQRRGLRVAMGRPYYVVSLDAESNTVTLGPKEEVMHRKLSAGNLNWLIAQPQSDFRADVKIRYNSKAEPATVYPQADSVFVEFDEPVSAITPGQLAAFYIREGQNNRIIGGGWIDEIQD